MDRARHDSGQAKASQPAQRPSRAQSCVNYHRLTNTFAYTHILTHSLTFFKLQSPINQFPSTARRSIVVAVVALSVDRQLHAAQRIELGVRELELLAGEGVPLGVVEGRRADDRGHAKGCLRLVSRAYTIHTSDAHRPVMRMTDG